MQELQNNEEFLDFILQAIQIGIRNHQEEKRKALKNSIINSALHKVPGFALQQVFLSYIDTFTEWHIKLLKLMNDPQAWFKENKKSIPGIGMTGSIRGTISAAYSDLNQKQDFINLIWTDLYNRELLSSDKTLITVGMTPVGAIAGRTTSLGQKFITFISA